MWKWILGGLAAVIAGAVYWLLFAGASAAKAPAGYFDISDWRRLAIADEADRPTGIKIHVLGKGEFPSFVTQAGRFAEPTSMVFTAFEITTPTQTIMVGGAVDAETAAMFGKESETAGFFEQNYQALLDRLLVADQVLMTHEHLDHIMAIARHPQPDLLAPKLVLNQSQIETLPLWSPGGVLPEAYEGLTPRLDGSLQAIAPGVVVVPAPGHTAGSEVVFVSLANGEEVTLIGDIAWVMTNISELKTRPILTQYVAFDPNEDRANIKAQLRSLHDMMAANPDLTVMPSHDYVYLKGLQVPGIELLPEG